MVVTTVVEVPLPRVYVRMTDSSPDAPLVAAGPGPLPPVVRGIIGVTTAPSAVLVAVAEYEAWAAELADSACSTGQTVWNFY